MRKLIAAALILGGCISKGTDVPPVSVGDGLTVKDQVVSIDPSKVPLLPPDCGPNQVVVKGPAGTFVCAAAAANAQSLGGKPADSYALKTDTVANAMTLGSHPPSDFLAAGAQAVDSAMLAGKAPSSYAAATAGVANNSAQLGGLPPSSFAAATNGVANSSLDSAGLGGKPPASYAAATNGVANNSTLLNGLPSTSYAAATSGVANNSTLLNGLPSSSFATAAPSSCSKSGCTPPLGTAANSSLLGGLAASQFIRSDVGGSATAPINMSGIQTNGSAAPFSLTVGETNGGGIFGSNGAGNLHLDADDLKSDGRVYLNLLHGKGVAFGDGKGGVVASVDKFGTVTAASFNFNGMQLIRRDATVQGPNAALNCNQVCNNQVPFQPGLFSSSATCVAARLSNVQNLEYPAACSDNIVNPGNAGAFDKANARCFCTTW